ncbi:TetR/AcrR family transcriptional regulator [Longimicrobium sp.]|uniref:TetR/AcrR family transcriptional regulator n=1 Tax=Longimicrobium sp. TaxID=2029185 RepID=UPI002E31B4BD|nr:TetR/AcrR family transcriptional regulator [Longimicrobium sp.]HEX6041727.1 TetR/AcrR family transcriptional regulator [Longimicrobium sp.]
MVRYSRGHKEKTREQIVDTAARAFREEGVSGVGIGELMGRAGLTHGGFYAHFPSKDALVAEACGRAVDQTWAQMHALVAQAPPGEELATFIRAYVSRTHRDDPGGGCMMPSIGSEMARQDPDVRAAFTAQIRRVLENIQALMPDTPNREDRALTLLSGMAGAVLLSRAIDDPAMSDRILKLNRDFWIQQLAG